MARRAGVRSILVETGFAGRDGQFRATPDFVASNLTAAADVILRHRNAVKCVMIPLSTMLGVFHSVPEIEDRHHEATPSRRQVSSPARRLLCSCLGAPCAEDLRLCDRLYSHCFYIVHCLCPGKLEQERFSPKCFGETISLGTQCVRFVDAEETLGPDFIRECQSEMIREHEIEHAYLAPAML